MAIVMSRLSFSSSIARLVSSLKSVNLSVSDLERFTADTIRYAVTLTYDPLTFNVCSLSTVTRSTSVADGSEIEQSADDFKD